jgi:hypothetical protein
MDETFRVSGIEIRVTPSGEVWHLDRFLGRVAREQRLGEWFWRAFDPDTGEPVKRFMSARAQAIQLLLLRSDLIEGIGY